MTFPRTSPEMYAEYWNPMNWKSMALAMNMRGHEVAESGPKENPLVRCALLAAALS